MITEHHVQRSPEECARHLLLEVVLSACNDWLICREREWRPAITKGKFPNGNDIAELRMFFREGWIDRLLHMAGSRLCGDRILSALESKPRMEFSRKKSADRSSETNMLNGSDEVCIMTGEADTPIGGYDMLRACAAWLERREDGYRRKSRSWNDLDFHERKSKRNRNQTNESTTN
jgi:hypothetical protein